MAKKSVKKRLLLVGGVVALGAVAYYLYSKSQEAPALPPPSGGGGGLPKPTPKPVAKSGPSPGQIQAYKDAVANLDKWKAWIAANRPTNQAELDAMVAKTEEFKAAVRATAAVIGVSPGV